MIIKEEFDKRILEINLYFEILESIEKDKPKLISNDFLTGNENIIVFDSEKINIFRASAFLLLYNIVESTVFNSVNSIFDEINTKGHKYNDVIIKIKRYWLDNIYKHDERIKKATLINSFIEITNKIFNESLILASNYIKYGGSLDADKIIETAESLGINTKEILFKKQTKDAFIEVKDRRNWLAHGEKSFAEIGKDYDYIRLNEWKIYIIEHLENFIKSVENYIEEEKYLEINQVEIV